MSIAPDVTPDPDDVLEGFPDEQPGIESYPLDSLLIRTEPRTIQDVLRRVKSSFIKLDPDFQRDFKWDSGRQSRLIESILMRIPLPVFYVAEDEDGKLVVVDGLQRIMTLKRFNDGVLQLELENPELNGKNIDNLLPKLRNRFEDGQLLFYIIDAKAPERVRLDVFGRVNSGVPLTRQEMRNALYSGEATALLRTLADAPEFKSATGYALDKQEYRLAQRDREVINRFVAFRILGWRSYGQSGRADMDEFLATALRTVKRMTDAERETLREGFLRSMERNERIFGKYAFRKRESPNQQRKYPFNLALFEVFSVLLAAYPVGRVEPHDDALREGFYQLMAEPRFRRSISAATTSTDTVQRRFDLAEKMIQGVLGDP